MEAAVTVEVVITIMAEVDISAESIIQLITEDTIIMAIMANNKNTLFL